MQRITELEVARDLWDHLPLGVLVIDEFGDVRMANERALLMTGWNSIDEVAGRTVFDFIVDEDLAFVMAGMDRNDDFAGVVLGPFRLRYIARDGSTHWSECWAYDAPESVGFAGHVVTLTGESVSDRLNTAMRGIATGVELCESLGDVARSLESFPVVATSAILALDESDIVGVAGTWPLDIAPGNRMAGTPWATVAANGDGGEFGIGDLPPHWRDAARRAGVHAVWTAGIDVDDRRRGVLVMWRPMCPPPTPNQRRHIDEARSVAALAYSQHDHRTHLAEAAQRDHLTGVGNRARLARAIDDGLRPSGVLYVDIDDFKAINDRHGHAVGDQVLRTIATRLDRALGPLDRLFRIGGDEFLVVSGDADSVVDAGHMVRLAERLVDDVSQPALVSGESIDVAISVGVAHDADPPSLGALMARADRELFGAKRSGKRRWQADSDLLLC